MSDTIEKEPAGYNQGMIAMAAYGTPSTSFLQRQLKLGYNAAAELMERYEANKIISAPNAAGKRKFLVTIDEIKLQQREEAQSATAKALDAATEAAMGHNSKNAAPLLAQVGDSLSETAREKLRLTVERVERLEEEKKEVAEQIKEVYGEAKALGYDTKALRSVIRLRKQDRTERQEQEAILEVYLDALGEL